MQRPPVTVFTAAFALTWSADTLPSGWTLRQAIFWSRNVASMVTAVCTCFHVGSAAMAFTKGPRSISRPACPKPATRVSAAEKRGRCAAPTKEDVSNGLVFEHG